MDEWIALKEYANSKLGDVINAMRQVFEGNLDSVPRVDDFLAMIDAEIDLASNKMSEADFDEARDALMKMVLLGINAVAILDERQGMNVRW